MSRNQSYAGLGGVWREDMERCLCDQVCLEEATSVIYELGALRQFDEPMLRGLRLPIYLAHDLLLLRMNMHYHVNSRIIL